MPPCHHPSYPEEHSPSLPQLREQRLGGSEGWWKSTAAQPTMPWFYYGVLNENQISSGRMR